MSSEQQLNRVIVAKDIVQKAPLHKTKRAFELLGDESLALSRCLVDEIKGLLSELAQCKQEITQLKLKIKEFHS